jgi:N-ethylmaleimide reductase
MTDLQLLSPITLGAHRLANRVVMGPMTRSRADEHHAPTDLAATYYAQRASAGLIISEGAQVSPQGRGYPGTPGLHDAPQLEGWRKVTEAVHAAGGLIFAQLWHVGRVSHSSLQPGGALPVAPSAIPATGKLYTAAGPVDYETPRALETPEIEAIVAQFRAAAAFALEAGFDGVEVQAANGYLLDQFLRDGSNQRTDRYGGSVENRIRFLTEVVDAVLDAVEPDRLGVRLSPTHPWNGMSDSDPQALFGKAAAALAARRLAYLHLVQNDTPGFDWSALKAAFGGPVIAAGGYDRARAEAAVRAGEADLVAFGEPFIANPDLVQRFRLDAPLAQADRTTYYAGGARGYTDYPALARTLQSVFDIG